MIRATLVMAMVVAQSADAAPVALPRTKAVLDVPASWTRIDHPSLVAAYRSPHGLVLAVTRADVGNPDAWRKKTREAYADQIEKGALGVDGKRIARKLAEVNGVPALDLDLRRSDGSAVAMRVLLFYTYSLALAIEVPKGKKLDEAHAITRKFAAPPRKHD